MLYFGGYLHALHPYLCMIYTLVSNNLHEIRKMELKIIAQTGTKYQDNIFHIISSLQNQGKQNTNRNQKLLKNHNKLTPIQT